MTDPWCCYINGAPWIPSRNTPFMLALIYQHHGSVMGHGIKHCLKHPKTRFGIKQQHVQHAHTLQDCSIPVRNWILNITGVSYSRPAYNWPPWHKHRQLCHFVWQESAFTPKSMAIIVGSWETVNCEMIKGTMFSDNPLWFIILS